MSMTQRSSSSPRSRGGRQAGILAWNAAGLKRLPAAGAVMVLALVACAGEPDAEFEAGEDGATQSPTSSPTDMAVPEESLQQEDEEDEDDEAPDHEEEVLVAEVEDPVEISECDEADEADDITVTWLDDVIIPEQEHPGVEDETVEIEGETVVLPGAPGIVVPERVGQAGCIIEYDAPGACLPAVTISAAYVPGYTLPERSIPEVELPDGTVLDEVPQQEVQVSAVEQSATHQDEACQPDDSELEDGDYVPMAHRSITNRSNTVQGMNTHSIQTRSMEHLDDAIVPQMVLPQVVGEQLVVPQVVIPQEILEAYRLEGAEDTERTDRDDSVSYITEGDVLFDSDEYAIRSDAASELQAIADDIAARGDEVDIQVEGHTDDVPTSVYEDNYELSELRAESVVDWLIDNADIDSEAITAIGRAEDFPRADNNTDEGRQLNRRVVITVEPIDGADTEIDYELEDN